MEQTATNNKSETTNPTLVNYRDEEKLMSESLYRNLHVLCRFHEPTADFLELFQPHMFIKSNPKAFLFVIHFIFNCLDANEFNKRFRWPIYDKAGETVFRKVALDYMNHLNVIHHLGMETLKLSNIHIPGGLKFIKIIHKFTHLAMKLELNKASGPLPDLQHIPDADAMFVKLEQYVEQGMDYATKLQAQSEKLSKRIDEMRTMMEPFLLESTESAKQKICWTCLQQKWKEHLDCVVRDELAPQLEVVNLLSRNTVQLNQLLTKLFVDKRENVIEYDRHQLMVAQKWLKEVYPEWTHQIDGIVEGNIINFANLFKVFSLLLPKMTDKLKVIRGRGTEAIEYEFNRIVEYDEIAAKYDDALNECIDQIQPFNEKELENFQMFCQNNFNLQYKPFKTPSVARQPEVNGMLNRLRLIDDSCKRTQLFKKPATRKASNKNATLRTSSCSTLSGFKSRGAAMQLLAKPKSSSNLSLLSLPNMTGLGRFSTPKFSSTMASARNRPDAKPAEMKFTPSFPMTPTGVFAKNVTETTSIVSPNGISVVRKVEKSSVMQLNRPHIRSPTRRFYVTNISPEFAAMMQSNADLDKIINGHRSDAVPYGRHLEMVSESGEDSKFEMSNGGAEKNHPVPDATSSSSLQTVEDGVEFIGDISDTVLNDVFGD